MANRPLTTPFGSPFVTRWRGWLNFAFFPAWIVTAELGTLSHLPGSANDWFFLLSLSPYALLATSQLGTRLVHDRQRRRLDDADGLLCLHCGRAMEKRGPLGYCRRCDDYVRKSFVRRRWGWKGPSSGRREKVTISPERTARTARNWPAWTIGWVILAISLLPLYYVWREEALFVILIPILIAVGAYGVGQQAKKQLEKRARRECLKCGYSLVGHEEWSCPECGQQVDWSDDRPERPHTPSRAIKSEGTVLLTLIAASIACCVFSYSAASTYTLTVKTEFSATLLGTPAQAMVPGALEFITDPQLDRRARAIVLQMLTRVERGPAWIAVSGALMIAAFVCYHIVGSRVRAERERNARPSTPEVVSDTAQELNPPQCA